MKPSLYRNANPAKNVLALPKYGPSSPFANDAEALQFPKDTYTLIYKSRKIFRDKTPVIEAIEAAYPGCVVGRQRLSSKFWVFEVQLPKGAKPPSREAPPTVTPESQKIVNKTPGIAENSMWCSGCACQITCPKDATHHPVHKAMGSTLLCRKSGKPIPMKKEK